MAHASSAGAPFDSEVSTADLDSEAFATNPSATLQSSSSTTGAQTMSTEAMQIDILTQLLDTTTTSTSSTDNNCATDTTATLLSDPSIIAMTTSSTSAWAASSPSISPLALKLESPLLSSALEPASKTPAKPKSQGKPSSSSPATSSRKRTAADPSEKEAKALQRVLRNRAAAQESRDKKRKYVTEIEASNEHLQQENSQLLKRLKTVESDNLALSQRLEAFTAQFTQMQQLLSQSVKQNQPGVGFCQSAVLAKKDKKSRSLDNLTNSPQQKLAPPRPQKTLYTMTSKQHRQVYSMTMKNWMDKTDRNREARSSDQSAAQSWMEISCRSFCNNNRKRALTLSSSAAVSSLATRPTQQLASMVLTMVFLTSVLPQLMLNFSTLFLISTGVRSSNPQELQLQQTGLSFIRRLSLSHPSNDRAGPFQGTPIATTLRSRTIKDNINSLNR
ncbi:hypothetical protein BGZ65_009918 [Modicella reniformis]|uniref:BZIP domain-containing protein n=1 Tax=Modicella reniformis TaxID=1440133 RepID=A0A9P6ISI6_9FUNG|nr:hypothetical protein BGZ65_009918 [Modicella reniformis]